MRPLVFSSRHRAPYLDDGSETSARTRCGYAGDPRRI